MPIYEYRCPNCGVWEDIKHKFSRYDKCPKCGSPSAITITTAPKFVGSGTFEQRWLNRKENPTLEQWRTMKAWESDYSKDRGNEKRWIAKQWYPYLRRKMQQEREKIR